MIRVLNLLWKKLIYVVRSLKLRYLFLCSDLIKCLFGPFYGSFADVLWSYAFSFRLEGTLRCSSPFMIIAFVNSGKNPTFILIDATTW